MRVLIGTTVQNVDRVDMDCNKLILMNDDRIVYHVYIESLAEREEIIHQLLKNGWADLSEYSWLTL